MIRAVAGVAVLLIFGLDGREPWNDASSLLSGATY